MKKILIFGSYSVSSFYSNKVIFDNITISGCVYAVDCIIDGFGNCHITQQLIPTKQSVIRCRFRFHVFTCPWPIDIENLMELGRNALDISKLSEAIQLFRRAYDYKGEYNKAIEYYEKDLKISLSELGYDHPDVATSYNNLGNVYQNKGEYDKAIEYNEKSLKIRLDKLGHDHPAVATLYNNVGIVYSNKGEYNKAIEYHEKS
ncbi:hypothetical protein RFI_01140 [Reticulomyxa filosa]|uniref:Uncharacterized protein n=1 Tax=Reticulomyxa filosa TaxID=46433 RepID=X6PCK9_RETFI|nr:hypothetical protein RFI_01140 [Reticulomyxa filosa]|eukprot:ETO35921.1 hypothetical protein RFI_01140 [Reticulomyxa filosa]